MISWLNITPWINRRKRPKSAPSWGAHPRYPTPQRTESVASTRTPRLLSYLLVRPARLWQLIEILHGHAQAEIPSYLRITGLKLLEVMVQVKIERIARIHIH